jgi:hypothetical protein
MMDDDLRERWPSMTNAERQALIDQWDRNNGQVGAGGSGNVTSGPGEGPKRGGESPMVATLSEPATMSTIAPAAEPVNTSWKQDAMAYGFTPEQLNDPEIAAYIKQLWEMGWIPQTA